MDNANQPSGQTDNTSSDDQTTNPQNHSASGDTVAYGTHKKLLAEKKNLQSRFEEMEKQFNSMNEDKLTSEGKKDELLEAYKAKLNGYEEKFNNFAYSAVSNNVALEANKMGCVDQDALVKLVDLTSLNVGDNFSVDKDEVKVMLEDVKKQRPYLFKAINPNINTGTPKDFNSAGAKGPDFSKMTQAEMVAYANKNGIK
jgi:hypothetical protein